LFTPITSVTTSGEYAVVVSVAAPGAIAIVTQLGGAQAAAAEDAAEVLVLHEEDVQ